MMIHAKTRAARWLCIPAALAWSCLSLPVHAQNSPMVMSQLPGGGNALVDSSFLQQMQQGFEKLQQQVQQGQAEQQAQMQQRQMALERQQVMSQVLRQMQDPPNDAQLLKLQELVQRAQEAQPSQQSPTLQQGHQRMQQMVQQVLQRLQQPAQQSPQAAEPMQGAQQAQQAQASQSSQGAQQAQMQEQSAQQAQQTQEQKAQQHDQMTEAQRILEMQKEAGAQQIDQMQKQQAELQTQSQSQDAEKLQRLYQAYFGTPADTGMMTDLATVSQTMSVSMMATLGQVHQELQQNPNFFQPIQPFNPQGGQAGFNAQGLEQMFAAMNVMEQSVLAQFASIFETLQNNPFLAQMFAQMGLNPDFTPGSGIFGGTTTSTSSGGCPPGQTFIFGVGCV